MGLESDQEIEEIYIKPEALPALVLIILEEEVKVLNGGNKRDDLVIVYRFGTSSRSSMTKNALAPGPGAYNIPSKIAEVPKYAMSGPMKIHL
jgi:hypothetical protein